MSVVRPLLWLVAMAAVVVIAVGAGVVWWSGATLAADPSELARVDLQPLAGSLVSARAALDDGRPVPLRVSGGRLTPRARLRPGAEVHVDVVVRRPSWLGWAIGRERHEHLTVRTPVAVVQNPWLTLPAGSPLRVRFASPVDRIAVGTVHPTRALAVGGKRVVTLGRRRAPAGSVLVAAAARPWERLGEPFRVSWFPHTSKPGVLVSPAAKTVVSPLATIRLTFAQPIAEVLGGSRPHFSHRVGGSWRQPDAHTLEFRPTGFGFPFESSLRLDLPRTLSVIGGGRRRDQDARSIGWTVPGGSVLRLHQLLADAGYLPVDWHPAGDPVARTPRAEVAAAVAPPAGSFSWRFHNTPPQLSRQWVPDRITQITRGAVMMFQHDHDLTVDAFAGPMVWHALLLDAIGGKRRTGGYSYVYVHTHLPQLLTLWHNGETVLTSPGNTGIPATPTDPGTFPVFEHIPVGTMSGTNPDGTHYHDPGIRWISYFHGGEALHAFTRASFGTPQSLGCVELPLEAAAKVWPYTPIGTLVTIEN
jgi:hypothetical protein